MTDQADDTDKKTELAKLIEQWMHEGKVASFYDPAMRELVIFKTEHAIANPNDMRRN